MGSQVGATRDLTPPTRPRVGCRNLNFHQALWEIRTEVVCGPHFMKVSAGIPKQFHAQDSFAEAADELTSTTSGELEPPLPSPPGTCKELIHAINKSLRCKSNIYFLCGVGESPFSIKPHRDMGWNSADGK